MWSAAAMAAVFGIVFASLYQNHPGWEWYIYIATSIMKFGLWLTPLAYIANKVTRAVRHIRAEEDMEEDDEDEISVKQDKGNQGRYIIKGILKGLRMLKPYLTSTVTQLSLLGCLGCLVLWRFINMYEMHLEKNIVDALTNDRFFCWELLLTKFSLGYVKTLLSGLSGRLYTKFSTDITRDFKLKLFVKLHSFSLRWHLEHKSAEIHAIMGYGAESLLSILSFLLYSLIPQAVDLIITIRFLVSTFTLWQSLIISTTMGLYLSILTWSKLHSQKRRTRKIRADAMRPYSTLQVPGCTKGARLI